MKRLLLLCWCSLSCLGYALGSTTQQPEVSVENTPLTGDDVHQHHTEFMTGARTYFGQMMEGQEHRFATVMNSIDSYIDFFASQDFRTLPDWELKIMDLVKEGRFSEGIEGYEERDLEKEYFSHQIPFGCVERYVMLLQLSGVRSNSMKGLDLLQSICERDTSSMAPLRVLVDLCIDLRLHNMADEYLSLYQDRANGNPMQIAEIYGLRSWVLTRRNRPNESLTFARRSIALYDSLSRVSNNPDFQLLNRARTHQALGRIYYRMEDKDASIANIRACRNCYARESQRVDGSCLTERLRCLYNLAPLAADQNDFFLADSIYTEIDELGRWLFEDSSSKQNQFLFNSFRLRGLACYRVGKLDEARTFFTQAEEVLKKLEAESPGQNVENYQNLYFNIASLYYSEGNIQKALEMDRVVLQMVLIDKTHDARRHQVDLGYCYKYIGNCLWALGYEKYLAADKRKTKEVMRYYQEAMDNYALALQNNTRDNEAASKYNLAQLIMSGMEKPMAMPKNF